MLAIRFVGSYADMEKPLQYIAMRRNNGSTLHAHLSGSDATVRRLDILGTYRNWAKLRSHRKS